MQTIFALATARGKSGVAVIRLSGPQARDIGTALCRSLPEPGRFALRPVYRKTGDLLDRALVLTFEAPKSFTGEDVVELHIHGSLAIIDAVQSEIAATGLARLAKPGEFTQRALLNGQMDLPQVEGLSDLIAAETEAQRAQAQQLLDGALRTFADGCRDDLLRAVSLIEATIDFADEDVPVDVTPEVTEALESVKARLEAQLAGFEASERLRAGFEVAIIGAPNAGKSTLLNRIAGREIAITSDRAGTTRDVLEVRVDLKGLPVTFLDTAGLRESTDEIEQIGVARARDRASNADIRIFLSDGTDAAVAWDVEERAGDIRVANKADLTGQGISAKTGEGLDEVLEVVRETLASRLSSESVASHIRHRMALAAGLAGVEAGLARVRSGSDALEIVAIDLRDALYALDSLIGRVDVEVILGEIFSQFCIGK